MKKKIAIIGSGIGGLTAANLLIKNSDFEIMVYEKERMLSLNEGYGIQLATNSISCLLYTSPSPRDGLLSRMPSSA